MTKKRTIYSVDPAPKGSAQKWWLRRWNGTKRTTEVTALVSDTKASFVRLCREYVRAMVHLGPRQLLIRDRAGKIIAEASYDCDSRAKG